MHECSGVEVVSDRGDSKYSIFNNQLNYEIITHNFQTPFSIYISNHTF